MSQLIDLGKLRFHFAGEWSGATTYESNDIVKYGGNVYVYTYGLKTNGHIPTDTVYWALMIEGFKFKGVFDPAVQYRVGDGIAHGGKVYVAVLDSTGQTPPNNTYWSQFADGLQYEGAYSNTKAYQRNDIATLGGVVYIAKVDTTGNNPTNTTYWDKLVDGISPQSVYNGATNYSVGDLVAYGSNIYRCKVNSVGNLPTNSAYWDPFLYGYSNRGTWNTGAAYKIGEIVTYGGSTYQAKTDNNAIIPSTNPITWDKVTYGFRNRGDWSTATEYITDDVIVYGGNTYIALLPHASTVFATDLAANKWQKFNSGIKWRGVWSATTGYKKDDIVKDASGGAYIALIDHTSTTDFSADRNAAKWELFASGGSDVLPAINPGDTGRAVTLSSDGSTLDWIGATESDKVFYVAPHGVDDVNHGKNLSTPFASVKYATQQCGTDATIFVKTGTYNEQLPITIPANVAIVGDNQRTVVIQPKTGNSDDGTTPNAQSTMFYMSNGSILNKMTFKGMTGWAPNASTPEDVTSSTIKGVVVRLNPASPITTKSPYVLECAFIGSGAIGALIDGTAHTSGAKTMIFHGYTVISDNGVGYWVKDGGKAEIVSCFTYYCYFGYTASGGGFIRALNGNNSYGTWGATSRGYDSSETPGQASIYGQQLNFLYTGGNINVGDTVTSSSGATAKVTNVQTTANKVYVTGATGTWTLGNTLTFTSGGTGTVSAGALENQKGFILVLTGMSSRPVPGASISLAGDTFSYVIQSVSGTYTNSSSVLSVVLAQEKPTGSASGVSATIRYKYSQIRLTGHDFLSIGTGGVTTTNYPGEPTQPASQGNEVDETYPGRVYYVSTDQNGNFRVGEYFRIDQATGRATLNASAFDLAGLTSLKLGSIGAQLGETINEFSSDATMSGNSNTAVPTEYAVKTYVDNSISGGVQSSINTILAKPVFSTTAQANKAGYYLRTNGTESYWDSMIQLTGPSTFNYATGYAGSITYSASSLVIASPTFVWSLINAPTGVTINSSTGLVSIADTTAAGAYNIIVSVTDGKFTAKQAVALSIIAGYPIFMNNAALPTMVPPNGSVSLDRAVSTVTGATYSISSGALPSWLSLNTTTGVISGTAPSTTADNTTYNFVVTVTKNTYTNTKTFAWTFQINYPQGQAIFTSPGSYSWTAPAGVTSVSVVAVGAGAPSGYSWSSGGGGGGGGLGWKNNIPVTPGQAYTVCVGCSQGNCQCIYATSCYSQAGSSWFISCGTVMGGGAGTRDGECCFLRGGGYCGDGGGCGGNSSDSWPSAGGSGAGGYTGSGGWACYSSCCPGCGGGGSASMGNYSSTYGQGGGGGTGLYGCGASGQCGFNAMQQAMDGYGCYACGGYGGQGGSYCCGTGRHGHQGENSCRYCYNYVGWDYPGSSCFQPGGTQYNTSCYYHHRTGGYPGGGGGGTGSSAQCNAPGGHGGLRIIWGNNRSFPGTNTGDMPVIGG